MQWPCRRTVGSGGVTQDRGAHLARSYSVASSRGSPRGAARSASNDSARCRPTPGATLVSVRRSVGTIDAGGPVVLMARSSGERERRLAQRDIDARSRVAEITVPRVRHDPHGGPRKGTPNDDVPPEWILARPQRVRCGLTQEDRQRRASSICRNEAAPAENAHTERREVVGRHDLDVEHGIPACLPPGLSLGKRRELPPPRAVRLPLRGPPRTDRPSSRRLA